MISRFGRDVLLSAASVLVLAAAPALAEDGIGLGIGGGAEAGIGVGVGDGAEVSADVGADADAQLDGAKLVVGSDSVASPDDPVHMNDGAVAADAAAHAEADARIGVDAGGQGAITGTVATATDIDAMTIAQFSGKRLEDSAGAGIGTVEAVAVDADSELFLVTALDAMDEDGQERLIPFDQVSLNAQSDALVLAQGSAETAAQMDALSASAATLVDSDAKLQALLAAD